MKKAEILALAVVIALFSGVSHADSCNPGGVGVSFASLINTSCTIGNTTLTFNSGYSGNISGLILTSESAPTAFGFVISGFPGTNGQQTNDFIDSFTAAPLSGTTITSTWVTLNSVSQGGTGLQDSRAALSGTGTSDYDHYVLNNGSSSEQVQTGVTPISSFTGSFELYNGSGGGTEVYDFADGVAYWLPGTGSSSFQSANFVFNESAPDPTTVPEGSELGMLGITAVGLLAGMKKRFLAAD